MALVFDVQRTHSDGEYLITTDSGSYSFKGSPDNLAAYVITLMNPPVSYFLLLEDGFKLLQENGSNILV